MRSEGGIESLGKSSLDRCRRASNVGRDVEEVSCNC